MASYYLNVSAGSRGGGQSATAKHDYLLRERKYAKGEFADEVVAVAHGHMPSWAEQNPRSYWQAADEHERANGRLFDEIKFALPREFAAGQRIAAAHAHAERVTVFVDPDTGETVRLPYTWALHAGRDARGNDHNPHVHLMVSERGLDGADRTAATWFKRYNGKDPEAGGARKTRAFKRKDWLPDLRAWWAGYQNHRLAEAGHTDRVDHRSLVAQGIERLPQMHLGHYAHAIAKTGATPRGQEPKHWPAIVKQHLGIMIANRNLWMRYEDGRGPLSDKGLAYLRGLLVPAELPAAHGHSRGEALFKRYQALSELVDAKHHARLAADEVNEWEWVLEQQDRGRDDRAARGPLVVTAGIEVAVGNVLAALRVQRLVEQLATEIVNRRREGQYARPLFGQRDKTSLYLALDAALQSDAALQVLEAIYGSLHDVQRSEGHRLVDHAGTLDALVPTVLSESRQLALIRALGQQLEIEQRELRKPEHREHLRAMSSYTHLEHRDAQERPDREPDDRPIKPISPPRDDDTPKGGWTY